MDINTAAGILLTELKKKHSNIVEGGCITTSEDVKKIVIILKEDTKKIPEGVPSVYEKYQVEYFIGI